MRRGDICTAPAGHDEQESLGKAINKIAQRTVEPTGRLRAVNAE